MSRQERRMMKERALGWMAVLGVVLLGAACGGYEPDERSTDDKSRQGAREIPLDIAVTDAVNIVGGDANDWKVFAAPEPGQYTVEVFWDSTYVRGGVNIHDSYGQEVENAARNPGDSEPTIISFNASAAGNYFVRVRADEQYSVYSVRIYPGPRRTAGVEVADPRPEFTRPIE